MFKKILINGGLVFFSVAFALTAFDLAVYLLPKSALPEPLLKLFQQMEID